MSRRRDVILFSFRPNLLWNRKPKTKNGSAMLTLRLPHSFVFLLNRGDVVLFSSPRNHLPSVCSIYFFPISWNCKGWRRLLVNMAFFWDSNNSIRVSCFSQFRRDSNFDVKRFFECFFTWDCSLSKAIAVYPYFRFCFLPFRVFATSGRDAGAYGFILLGKRSGFFRLREKIAPFLRLDSFCKEKAENGSGMSGGSS